MHEFFVKLRDLRGKRLIADNVYYSVLHFVYSFLSASHFLTVAAAKICVASTS